jgi:hypothetical protein
MTPADFRAQFPRNFPYLPVWEPGRFYKLGDRVHHGDEFYRSLISGNGEEPGIGSDWEPYADNVANYVSDWQILGAFAEAEILYNSALLPTENAKKIGFLYLAAHYLSIDLRNIGNGSEAATGFPQKWRRAGEVAEDLLVPERLANNPILSIYLQTGYGQKYLGLILPSLVGNGSAVRGWTLP